MNSVELQEMWQQLTTLPLEAQTEVASLISLLHDRYNQFQPTSQENQQNLREDPFIGFWQDRENLADSTQWGRTLRSSEWQS